MTERLIGDVVMTGIAIATMAVLIFLMFRDKYAAIKFAMDEHYKCLKVISNRIVTESTYRYPSDTEIIIHALDIIEEEAEKYKLMKER